MCFPLPPPQAAGIGANVLLIDANLPRLRALALALPKNVTTLAATPSNIARALREADIAVGATLIAGAKTRTLVSRETLVGMKPGSVCVDVSVDQGGVTEVTRPTTHDDPVFKVSPRRAGGRTMQTLAGMWLRRRGVQVYARINPAHTRAVRPAWLNVPLCCSLDGGGDGGCQRAPAWLRRMLLLRRWARRRCTAWPTCPAACRAPPRR